MRTSGLGAADKIEADGVLIAGTAIELEPEHVGRDLGCALDRHAADQPERIGHTRALRRGSEILVGARPDDGGPPHGSDADRRGIMPAEQVDTDRRQGRGDAVARHELDRIERAPVAGDTTVGTSASVPVFKGEAGHVPAGGAAQISDGRKAAMQLDEARIVAGRVIVRSRANQSSRVVHEVPLGCPWLFPCHYSNGTRRATSVSPAGPSAAKKGRPRARTALDAQK